MEEIIWAAVEAALAVTLVQSPLSVEVARGG